MVGGGVCLSSGHRASQALETLDNTWKGSVAAASPGFSYYTLPALLVWWLHKTPYITRAKAESPMQVKTTPHGAGSLDGQTHSGKW